MNIQTNYPTITSPLSRVAPQGGVESNPPIQSVVAQDSFTHTDKSFFSSDTINSLKSMAVIGGVSLLGAAIGAAGGNYTGVIGGIGGAIAGASGGATAAMVLPGEKFKAGLLLGAIGGAIVGSSFGNTGLAVGLGLAGATIPLGLVVGVFSGAS